MTRLLVTLAVTVAVAWAIGERADAATCKHPKVANRLDAYLERRGSPAAGQGCAIAEEAIRGGIHPVFVVAVAGTESSYWIHGCYGNRWNGWGLSSCGPGWYVPYFPTLRQAVRFFVRFVNSRFGHAATPYSFHGYAACSSCWAAKTAQHMWLIGGAGVNVRWPW